MVGVVDVSSVCFDLADLQSTGHGESIRGLSSPFDTERWVCLRWPIDALETSTLTSMAITRSSIEGILSGIDVQLGTLTLERGVFVCCFYGAAQVLKSCNSTATVHRDSFPPMSVARSVVQRPQVKDIQLIANSPLAPAPAPIPPAAPIQSNVNQRQPAIPSAVGVQPNSTTDNRLLSQIQDPAILSVSSSGSSLPGILLQSVNVHGILYAGRSQSTPIRSCKLGTGLQMI